MFYVPNIIFLNDYCSIIFTLVYSNSNY